MMPPRGLQSSPLDGSISIDSIRARFNGSSAHVCPLDELVIQSGTMQDYLRLARFHYRPGKPAAPMCVLCVVDPSPTVVGRYVARRREERQVAGVLVRSRPVLSCRMRDIATSGRYATIGGLSSSEAAMRINREVRAISRVIIDPRYRGLGLAVRLVRHALARPQETSLGERRRDPWPVVLTEAFAAMGRICPFFEHAGMTRHGPADHRRPAAPIYYAFAHSRIPA